MSFLAKAFLSMFVRTAFAWLAMVSSAMTYGDASPILCANVNGSASAEIFHGMPMLVSISLVHPLALNDGESPFLIAAQQGPWTNAIHVEITDGSGNPQAWPFQVAGSASDLFLLTPTNFARLSWWLTPAQTLALANGSYSVRATLDTTGVGTANAWSGSVKSVPAKLVIRDEPANLSEAEAENKYRQKAQYDLFIEDAASSLAEANALLTLFPTNIAGLRLKAKALAASGQFEHAQAVVRQALNEVYARNPNAVEPPETLYSLAFSLEKQRVGPPQLSVTKANSEVSLKWSSYSDFSYWIESSTDLRLGQWSLLVTNPPSNIYLYSADPSGGQMYFRLGRAVGNPGP